MAGSTTPSQRRWKDAHPEKASEYVRNWQKRNPEKRKAHRAVERALKTSKLVRPDVCEECGRYDGWNGQSLPRIEAHHLDYSKPLEVEWLCKECHEEGRV